MVPENVASRIKSPDHIDRLGALLELRRLCFERDEEVAVAAADRLRSWNQNKYDIRVKSFLEETINIIERKPRKTKYRSRIPIADTPPEGFVPIGALHECRQRCRSLQMELEELKKKFL
jgi:hypothetical protein